MRRFIKLTMQLLVIFIISAHCQTQKGAIATNQRGTQPEIRDNNTTSTTSTTSTPTTNFNAKTPPPVVYQEADTIEPLRLSDLKGAGFFLLPTSIFFIVVNGFLLCIICIKWGQISDSEYRNSCLFCLYLTIADLSLSALVGLPVGLRLSFEVILRENDSMLYYTNTVAFVIYEYLTTLRMLIIAALSMDSFLHITRPFKYMLLATRMRVNLVSAFIAFLPAVKLIPMIFANIHCIIYVEPKTQIGAVGMRPSTFNAPLRCDLDINGTKYPGMNDAGIYLPGTIAILTWFIILVSNIGILALVIKKGTGFFSSQQREEMNRKLLKSCISIMLVTLVFAITNFPITCVKIISSKYDKNEITSGQVSIRVEFYVLILTFASLYFNPWLHVLRMRNIKEAVLGIKKRIMRAMSTHSTTVMPSPNPRLSKMSIQAMQAKRKSSAMTSTVREESPAAVRKATKPTLEQVIE